MVVYSIQAVMQRHFDYNGAGLLVELEFDETTRVTLTTTGIITQRVHLEHTSDDFADLILSGNMEDSSNMLSISKHDSVYMISNCTNDDRFLSDMSMTIPEPLMIEICDYIRSARGA